MTSDDRIDCANCRHLRQAQARITVPREPGDAECQYVPGFRTFCDRHMGGTTGLLRRCDEYQGRGT